ncbi:MAG: cytidylate kinase family protein, partial [Lachnospiraceae bacterium]|nr:cytidylate kinase family protein [Lachnospiraceae bacterium]
MNSAITIGREFGSGGREIAKKLAQRFDIPIFDKELLARAAKDSGLCEELLQNHDEVP